MEDELLNKIDKSINLDFNEFNNIIFKIYKEHIDENIKRAIHSAIASLDIFQPSRHGSNITECISSFCMFKAIYMFINI